MNTSGVDDKITLKDIIFTFFIRKLVRQKYLKNVFTLIISSLLHCMSLLMRNVRIYEKFLFLLPHSFVEFMVKYGAFNAQSLFTTFLSTWLAETNTSVFLREFYSTKNGHWKLLGYWFWFQSFMTLNIMNPYHATHFPWRKGSSCVKHTVCIFFRIKTATYFILLRWTQWYT